MNSNSWIFCARASRNSNCRKRSSSSQGRFPRREPEKFSSASCGKRSGAEKPAACRARGGGRASSPRGALAPVSLAGLKPCAGSIPPSPSEVDFILRRVDLLAVDAGHLQQVQETLEV